MTELLAHSPPSPPVLVLQLHTTLEMDRYKTGRLKENRVRMRVQQIFAKE